MQHPEQHPEEQQPAQLIELVRRGVQFSNTADPNNVYVLNAIETLIAFYFPNDGNSTSIETVAGTVHRHVTYEYEISPAGASALRLQHPRLYNRFVLEVAGVYIPTPEFLFNLERSIDFLVHYRDHVTCRVRYSYTYAPPLVVEATPSGVDILHRAAAVLQTAAALEEVSRG